MPHFAIIARDGPDGNALRSAHRDAHFAHIETIMDKVSIAGPLRTAEGGFSGSLVVVETADAGEAEAILKADPYFAAGVWSEWEVHPFLAAAGTWIGGKSW